MKPALTVVANKLITISSSGVPSPQTCSWLILAGTRGRVVAWEPSGLWVRWTAAIDVKAQTIRPAQLLVSPSVVLVVSEGRKAR